MEDEVSISDAALNDLIDLIGRQVDLYLSMERVLSKGKIAVINADLDAMNTAGSAKELLIKELGILETLRLELVKKLATSLNCPVQTLRLKQLGQMVPEPFSSRLKAAYLNLLGVTRRVGKINQAYQTLISQALSFTRGSIGFISAMTTPHSTYHATGKIQNRKQRGLFMSGAI